MPKFRPSIAILLGLLLADSFRRPTYDRNGHLPLKNYIFSAPFPKLAPGLAMLSLPR